MPKQKYRMLKTLSGVHDGELHPTLFQKGTEHDIDDELASQFIDQGAVELIDMDVDDGNEEKSRGGAPSNKSRGPAPSNKGRKSAESEAASE